MPYKDPEKQKATANAAEQKWKDAGYSKCTAWVWSKPEHKEEIRLAMKKAGELKKKKMEDS